MAGGHYVVVTMAQAVSSVSNILLTVAVARSASAVEFGIFALVYPTYIIAQRYFRTSLMTPLQVRLGRFGEVENQSAPTKLLYLSGFVGVVMILGSFYLPGASQWLLAFGVCIPFLMLYDWERHERILQRRYLAVLLGDAGWLTGQSALFIVLHLTSAPGVTFVFAWACPAAALGVARSIKARFKDGGTSGTPHRPRSNEGTSIDGLTDVLSMLVLTQGMMLLAAPYLGIAVIGGIRGVQSLLGPVTLVLSGLLPLLQVRLASPHSSSLSVLRTVLLAFVFTGAATTALATLLTVYPSVGHFLLGDTWSSAQGSMYYVAAITTLNASLSILYANWRARGSLLRLASFRLASAVGQASAFIVGAVAAGSGWAGWAWCMSLFLFWVSAAVVASTQHRKP